MSAPVSSSTLRQRLELVDVGGVAHRGQGLVGEGAQDAQLRRGGEEVVRRVVGPHPAADAPVGVEQRAPSASGGPTPAGRGRCAGTRSGAPAAPTRCHGLVGRPEVAALDLVGGVAELGDVVERVHALGRAVLPARPRRAGGAGRSRRRRSRSSPARTRGRGGSRRSSRAAPVDVVVVGERADSSSSSSSASRLLRASRAAARRARRRRRRRRRRWRSRSRCGPGRRPDIGSSIDTKPISWPSERIGTRSSSSSSQRSGWSGRSSRGMTALGRRGPPRRSRRPG